MNDEQVNKLVDHFYAIAVNTTGDVLRGLAKGLVIEALDTNNKEWVERLRALPSYNESGYGEIVVNRDDIDALITTHSKENQ